MDRRQAVAMALLLISAAASWALLYRAGGEDASPDATPSLGVGYYANDARLSSTDEDGRVLYRVMAASVAQSPGDGSVALREVAIDYTPGARSPWNLRADTGNIPPDGQVIRLSGNVVVRTGSGGAPPAVIRTGYLDFDTRSEVATTEGEVTVDFDGNELNASGLRASLADGRVELLAQVNGRYVP